MPEALSHEFAALPGFNTITEKSTADQAMKALGIILLFTSNTCEKLW
jgi:hypothetical protein